MKVDSMKNTGPVDDLCYTKERPLLHVHGM